MKRSLPAAAAITLALSPQSAGAGDLNGVTLTLGKFKIDSGYALQALSVKNGTSASVEWIIVECGFLRGNKLVATGTASLTNLQAGQTGFDTAIGEDGTADQLNAAFRQQSKREGQRLTAFADALDLSIDHLIFGPYFGVPRLRRTAAHSAVNSTADPLELAVPKLFVPGDVGSLLALPAPLGSFTELLRPP